MKRIVIISFLVTLPYLALAQGNSEYAPGKEKGYEQSAKQFAPGHEKESGQAAKSYAPGKEDKHRSGAYKEAKEEREGKKAKGKK